MRSNRTWKRKCVFLVSFLKRISRTEMQLTITTSSGHIINLDVSEDLELENLKAQCEFELGVPSSNLVLVWNGRPLQDNKKTLQGYGIKNGDVLLVQQMAAPPVNPGLPATGGVPMLDFGSIAVPSNQPGPSRQMNRNEDEYDPKTIRDLLFNNPRERALLKERNPPLSEALESGSTERFIEVFRRQREEKLEKDRERIRLMTMDPFDPEAQQKIAEEIRLSNVESNMESAIEHVPESFGQVVMLYINCSVNGHPVKAFVDSGAQMTIMSEACAERCNIMRLVDRRWAGIAKGVGTQKIIGRVHLGYIKIENDFLQSSFSILENQPMDMLLGLDMLKRHQCCIDLMQNQLVIGTTDTKTRFLDESELPDHAKIHSISGTPSEIETEDQMLAEALKKSAQEAAGNTKDQKAQSKSESTNGGASSGTLTNISSSQPGVQNHGASGSGIRSPFPEQVIRRLVEKGFSRHDVVSALTQVNGNEDQALMALLARSLKF